MATYEQANMARKKNSNLLAKLGVHAIGIEEGGRFNKEGWIIVAYVQKNVSCHNF